MLKEKWEGTVDPQFRRLLLLPMALVRQEEALEFLLSVISTNDMQTACAAIAALGVYRHDGRLRERVRAAIVGPDQAQLLKVFESEFGSGTATVR